MAGRKTKESICEAVFKAGVVGAGGAGFPTHIKLQATADLVIANGVECEPLLFHDKHVMEDQAAEVLEGLRLAMTAVGAARGVIALKKKYAKAIEALEKKIKKKDNISFFFMDDYYPAGDEQEIVRAITGKFVPPGGIPLALGVVVSNVTTLSQIMAAQNGIPVTHRFLSVVGDLPHPCTASIPIGMSVGDVLSQTANGDLSDRAILTGGIMMGTPVDKTATVTKTTTAIIALPHDHPRMLEYTASLTRMKNRAVSACCQCQSCMNICPRYLLGHPISPNKNMRAMASGAAFPASAALCCECGLCTALVTCPMGISPRRMHQEIKKAMVREGIRNVEPWQIGEEHPLRDQRRLSSHRLKEKLGILHYDREPARWLSPLSPNSLKIPLKQHIGCTAQPVVDSGAACVSGELLATVPAGTLGAPIHCSVAGTIAEIDHGAVYISCHTAIPEKVHA